MQHPFLWLDGKEDNRKHLRNGGQEKGEQEHEPRLGATKHGWQFKTPQDSPVSFRECNWHGEASNDRRRVEHLPVQSRMSELKTQTSTILLLSGSLHPRSLSGSRRAYSSRTTDHRSTEPEDEFLKVTEGSRTSYFVCERFCHKSGGWRSWRREKQPLFLFFLFYFTSYLSHFYLEVSEVAVLVTIV